MLRTANLQYEDQDVKQDIKRTVGRPRKDRYPFLIKIGDGFPQKLEGQDNWNFRVPKNKKIYISLPENIPDAKWRIEYLGVAVDEKKNETANNRREYNLSLLGLPAGVATVLFTLSNENNNEVLAKRTIYFVK